MLHRSRTIGHKASIHLYFWDQLQLHPPVLFSPRVVLVFIDYLLTYIFSHYLRWCSFILYKTFNKKDTLGSIQWAFMVAIEMYLGYDSYHDLNRIDDSWRFSMREISWVPERTDCKQSLYFRQWSAGINGNVLFIVRGHRLFFNSSSQLSFNLRGVDDQKTIHSYHIQALKILSNFWYIIENWNIKLIVPFDLKQFLREKLHEIFEFQSNRHLDVPSRSGE